MAKNTVAVIYGGKSQEHEVSRQSAASIYTFLDRDKYDVLCLGIDRDGGWHYQTAPEIESSPQRGEMLALKTGPASGSEAAALIPGRGIFLGDRRLPIDIVFPVLHGPYGEDGTLQGLLEMLGLPYTGAGVLGSALAMDKERAKEVWQAQGLPIVDYIAVRQKDFLEDAVSRAESLRSAEQRLGFPVFVKPVNAGSSVGVAKVERAADLPAALTNAFRFDAAALVERAVAAREIECAVIGNDQLRVFPPGEIIPRHDFYSYEAKYLDPNGAALAVPAALPAADARQAEELAAHAYRALGIEGFARVDLFLDRADGRFFLNEINSIPGFTNISMFPRMCAAGGLPYKELLTTIIGYGLERHERRASLNFQFS